MDLGDGSLRSKPEEEETQEEGIDLNEVGIGMNGPSFVSEIRDLGSLVDSVKFDALVQSAGSNEKMGINGSCVDGIGKIDTLEKMNGERVGLEKEIDTAPKGTELPLESSEGEEDMSSQSKLMILEKQENLENSVQFNASKIGVNGPAVDELRDSGSNQDLSGKRVEIEKAVETSSEASESPSGVSGVSPTAKGFGLKKWRRIKRDLAKDGGGAADPSRILKRGLPNAEPVKMKGLSPENKQKSEGLGSPPSVNSSAKNLVFSTFPPGASDSEYRLVLDTVFAIGTDSENSEDQSSKSSTAASAPKPVVGFAKDKNKVKNTSGRSAGNPAHKAQQGKGKLEATKKHRGERVKIEKENSYSSVESDFRSSNAIFIERGSFARDTNGWQREGRSNYDGENSNEVQQSNEEVQVNFFKENGEEVEVVSREDVAAGELREKNEESENCFSHSDQDPLSNSVILLQAAQEALEEEVRKFGVIGKGPISSPISSSLRANLSANLPSEERKDNSTPLEAQLAKLSQKATLLEHELEEATAKLKAKESKLLELENILNLNQLPKKDTNDNVASLQGLRKSLEIELEDMFKSKIESEIEYLMMVRNPQTLKSASEDEISVLDQQKCLAENQMQMAIKLQDAENKANMLKRQAEELEVSIGELVQTKDVLKMLNNVYKFTFCFFIQMTLLCIVFAFFLAQLFPPSHGIVPT